MVGALLFPRFVRVWYHEWSRWERNVFWTMTGLCAGTYLGVRQRAADRERLLREVVLAQGGAAAALPLPHAETSTFLTFYRFPRFYPDPGVKREAASAAGDGKRESGEEGSRSEDANKASSSATFESLWSRQARIAQRAPGYLSTTMLRRLRGGESQSPQSASDAGRQKQTDPHSPVTFVSLQTYADLESLGVSGARGDAADSPLRSAFERVVGIGQGQVQGSSGAGSGRSGEDSQEASTSRTPPASWLALHREMVRATGVQVQAVRYRTVADDSVKRVLIT